MHATFLSHASPRFVRWGTMLVGALSLSACVADASLDDAASGSEEGLSSARSCDVRFGAATPTKVGSLCGAVNVSEWNAAHGGTHDSLNTGGQVTLKFTTTAFGNLPVVVTGLSSRLRESVGWSPFSLALDGRSIVTDQVVGPEGYSPQDGGYILRDVSSGNHALTLSLGDASSTLWLYGLNIKDRDESRVGQHSCKVTFGGASPLKDGPLCGAVNVGESSAAHSGSHDALDKGGRVTLNFTMDKFGDVPLVVTGLSSRLGSGAGWSPYSITLDGAPIATNDVVGPDGFAPQDHVYVLHNVRSGYHAVTLSVGDSRSLLWLYGITLDENSSADLIAEVNSDFPTCASTTAELRRKLLADGVGFELIVDGRGQEFDDYGDFLSAMRAHFQRGADFVIRVTMEGVSSPYIRIRQSDLYITGLNPGSPNLNDPHWTNLSESQQAYPRSIEMRLNLEALKTAAANAGKMARGQAVPSDDLSKAIASLAFVTSEAARFQAVEFASNKLISDASASTPWNRWKPLLQNWQNISGSIASTSTAPPTNHLIVNILTGLALQWMVANNFDPPFRFGGCRHP